MGVTADQLVEGGSVYLRIDLPRPGSPSEMRLKPARVLDVERGAASIRLLESGAELKAKFSRLEPDVEFLAARAKEEASRYTRKRSAARALVMAPPPPPPAPVAKKPEPLRVALAEHLQARSEPAPVLVPPPPPVPQWDPDELAPAPAVVAPPEPIAPPAAVDRAASEGAAWLEMGAALLRDMPPAQRADIEQQLYQVTMPQPAATPEPRQEMSMRKKANPNLAKRYTDELKAKALAELATPNPRGGLAGVARRFGVAPNTLDYWRRKAAETAPAPKAKPGPKPKAAPVAATAPDVEPALGLLERENRRLQATVAALLERAGPAEYRAAIEADNRRLQGLIDKLLGLEA